MEYLSSKLLAAIEFSALAHKEQLRKNPTHIPYFSHPAAVAIILTKAGYSEEVVIAGLLHDVIEDTKFTKEHIAEKFGSRITELVLGVTEPKSVSWQDRNAGYNEHLRTVDEETLAISAADLVANRQSLLSEFRAGHNPWTNFSKDSKTYAQKVLVFDRERINIIKQGLKHKLVEELEALEQEAVDFTNKLVW